MCGSRPIAYTHEDEDGLDEHHYMACYGKTLSRESGKEVCKEHRHMLEAPCADTSEEAEDEWDLMVRRISNTETVERLKNQITH